MPVGDLVETTTRRVWPTLLLLPARRIMSNSGRGVGTVNLITNPRVWGTFTRADLARRDGLILELFAMGKSYDEIAERVGLTYARVGQIIRGAR